MNKTRCSFVCAPLGQVRKYIKRLLLFVWQKKRFPQYKLGRNARCGGVCTHSHMHTDTHTHIPAPLPHAPSPPPRNNPIPPHPVRMKEGGEVGRWGLWGVGGMPGPRPWPGPPKEAPQGRNKKSVIRHAKQITRKKPFKLVQHQCCPEGKCFSHFLLRGASMAVFTPGRPGVQLYRNILQPRERHKPAITGTRAGGGPPARHCCNNPNT